MAFVNSLPPHLILWLVPILLTVHNVEEALFIGRWLENTKLPIRLPIRAPQFVAATILLTIGGFIVTVFAVTESQRGFWFYAVAAIQAIMFTNAFLPHIVAALWFRKYQPGVVTAILFNIPFSLYFFQRVISSESFFRSGLLLLVLVAPIATVVIAGSALLLGNVVLRLWERIHSRAAKME
jgi:hypothetical protein